MPVSGNKSGDAGMLMLHLSCTNVVDIAADCIIKDFNPSNNFRQLGGFFVFFRSIKIFMCVQIFLIRNTKDLF